MKPIDYRRITKASGQFVYLLIGSFARWAANHGSCFADREVGVNFIQGV